LTPDGSPDPAFSGDGAESVDVGVDGGIFEGLDVEIQSDGRIVIGGAINSLSIRPAQSPLLVRLEQDGDLDPSFPGLTRLPVPSVVDVAVHPTGILGVGPSVLFSDLADFVLFRRQVDGAPDPSFPRPDGSVSTNFDAGADEPSALSVQGDGRVLVAGMLRPDSPGARVGIARYLMSAGRRDQDADGIWDKPDRCPRGFAKRRRGCPRLRDDGSVSIELSPSRRFVFGSLSSDYRECMDRRRVQTLELRPGEDRLVRSINARYSEFDGVAGFAHNVSHLKPGRYYSEVRRSVVAVGICRADRSAVVRIPK
jgi:uncharacterized delta-60 repeat protein